MLKTKSEVSAITDFIEWLEKVCKKNDKKGVLLICHESYKFNPHLLIKSLLKYVMILSDRTQNWECSLYRFVLSTGIVYSNAFKISSKVSSTAIRSPR